MADRMIFGMRVLNITQVGSKINHRNNLSHTQYELDLAGSDSGIDYWYNMMPNTFWYCAGSFGTRSTGNTRFYWSTDAAGHPKKVLCADGTSRIITLALTHSNQNYPVGSILGYKQIIYQEGTAGKATGNHIHLECCEGCIKTKVRNRKGYYNLPNMLDPRRVFFILDGFTTVKNSLGLVFKHCSSVSETVEGATMKLNYGYSSYKLNGGNVHVVRGNSANGYSLHLISAGGYAAVKPLKDFDSDKLLILAGCGNNYFNLGNGTHYGVEGDSTVDGYSQEPKQDGFLAYSIGKDGTVSCVKSSDYWHRQDDVQMVCSPYSVRVHEGKVLTGKDILYSTACPDKDDSLTANSAAFLIDNDWCLAAFEKARPREILAFVQQFEGTLKELFIMDGGGSTGMFESTSGTRKLPMNTARKLPNLLVIAKSLVKATDIPVTPSDTKDPEKEETDYKKMYEELTVKYNDLVKTNEENKQLAMDLKKKYEEAINKAIGILKDIPA